MDNFEQVIENEGCDPQQDQQQDQRQNQRQKLRQVLRAVRRHVLCQVLRHAHERRNAFRSSSIPVASSATPATTSPPLTECEGSNQRQVNEQRNAFDTIRSSSPAVPSSTILPPAPTCPPPTENEGCDQRQVHEQRDVFDTITSPSPPAPASNILPPAPNRSPPSPPIYSRWSPSSSSVYSQESPTPQPDLSLAFQQSLASQPDLSLRRSRSRTDFPHLRESPQRSQSAPPSPFKMDSGLDKQLPDSPTSATTPRASRTTPSSPPFYGAGSLRRYTTRRDSRASLNISPASHREDSLGQEPTHPDPRAPYISNSASHRDRNLSDVPPPADSQHQSTPRRDNVDLADLASRLKALEETVEAASRSQRLEFERVGRLEGALRVEMDCLRGRLADVAAWKEEELASHVRWFQQRFEALRIHVEEVFAVWDHERHELLMANERMSRRVDAAAIDVRLVRREHQLLEDRVGTLSRSLARLFLALQGPATSLSGNSFADQ